eukprot:m51a1_g2661 hypothetical protein (426) ;mRNA; f:649421-651111
MSDKKKSRPPKKKHETDIDLLKAVFDLQAEAKAKSGPQQAPPSAPAPSVPPAGAAGAQKTSPLFPPSGAAAAASPTPAAAAPSPAAAPASASPAASKPKLRITLKISGQQQQASQASQASQSQSQAAVPLSPAKADAARETAGATGAQQAMPPPPPQAARAQAQAAIPPMPFNFSWMTTTPSAAGEAIPPAPFALTQDVFGFALAPEDSSILHGLRRTAKERRKTATELLADADDDEEEEEEAEEDLETGGTRSSANVAGVAAADDDDDGAYDPRHPHRRPTGTSRKHRERDDRRSPRTPRVPAARRLPTGSTPPSVPLSHYVPPPLPLSSKPEEVVAPAAPELPLPITARDLALFEQDEWGDSASDSEAPVLRPRGAECARLLMTPQDPAIKDRLIEILLHRSLKCWRALNPPDEAKCSVHDVL